MSIILKNLGTSKVEVIVPKETSRILDIFFNTIESNSPGRNLRWKILCGYIAHVTLTDSLFSFNNEKNQAFFQFGVPSATANGAYMIDFKGSEIIVQNLEMITLSGNLLARGLLRVLETTIT